MRRTLAACFALAVLTAWIACSEPSQPDAASSTGPSERRCSHEYGPCVTDDDCCQWVYHVCGFVSCEQGVCQPTIYDKTKSQLRGDCWTTTCSKSGAPHPRVDTTDVGDSGNPCLEDYCDEGFSTSRRLDGVPSRDGSGFCKDGKKVECLADADCKDASLLCSGKGKCVPPWCMNRIKDTSLGEGEVDCGGGGRCDPCRVTEPCNVGADCDSGVCGPDKVCAYESCDDGIKNGRERDVDCGWAACGIPCEIGQGCVSYQDCPSFSCWAGVCVPVTCDDGWVNGEETNVDCGGSVCEPCDD